MEGFWFKSELFNVEPGEDLETNPGCFGKSLAGWLASKLNGVGYATEIIPEDWGWCVLCNHENFMLWVGCGSIQTDSAKSDPRQIVWHCFTVTEIPFWRFWIKLTKGEAIRAARQRLHEALASILQAEPRIFMVEEPP